ncbi:hypothetical protein [Methylotuvimicrobium sp. KM1]|uniref:hypothetical protein n=1 Tax=Methylotuvimicrobium sp. KM1 TaxID=3377707 RepID=UPI003851531A
MAFETVFSAPDKVEFLYRAHQQGYFIRVFFVATTDPSINASYVLPNTSEKLRKDKFWVVYDVSLTLYPR